MQKHGFHTLFLFLIFIVPYTIKGQSISNKVEYLVDVEHFTIENGLSHYQISDLCKDPRGLIWIATRYGLNRFDGNQFKIFTEREGLYTDDIWKLYSGGEWIWCFYSPKANRDYVSFELFNTISEEIVQPSTHFKENIPFELTHIQDVFVHQDILFFKLKNQEVYSYTPTLGFQLLSFLKSGEYIIGVTERKHYWLSSKRDRLYFRELDSLGNELQKVSTDLTGKRKNTLLKIIKEDKDKAVWLSYVGSIFSNYGILKITPKGEITNLALPVLSSFKENANRYETAFLNEMNAYWDNGKLMTMNGDLLFSPPNNTRWRKILLLDENLTWFLDEDKGFYLVKIFKNKFDVRLKNKNIRGLTTIDNSLFAVGERKLHAIQNDSTTLFKPPYSYFNVLTKKDKTLLLTHNDQLINYQLNTQKNLSEYPGVFGEIWSLLEDKSGNVWYNNGHGTFKANQTTNAFQEIEYNEFNLLKKSIVYDMFEKKDGNILLSSTTGLYEYEPSKGIIAHYEKDKKGAFYLPATDFRHLYYDEKDDAFWLATGGEGLIYWQPSTKKVEVFSFENIKNNVLQAVYSDENGFLWLSTENGIIQFNKETHLHKIYLPKDGTSSYEFNRIAHHQDKTGRIYFGSINGVTIFHPNDLLEEGKEKSEANIVILEAHQYKSSTNRLERITTSLYENNRVKVRSGDRFFTLRLMVDNFFLNKDALFYYRMKGDKEWTISNTDEISISGMPYGDQIVEIKASLRNGRFSKILEIPVKVLYPIHLTWWFWLFIMIFGIGLTLVGIQWRTQQLQKQRNYLTSEVARQTFQIRKDKTIIEEQASELRKLDETKSRFFANVSHELRTPLSLVQGPIKSVLNTAKLNSRNFTLLSKAEQNTQSLLKLVNEILDLTKLEVNKLELIEEKILFYSYLRRIISNFESVVDEKGIELIFEYKLNRELQIKLDKDKFEKIINNLLSNALKFTQRGEKITVYAQDKNGCLHLYVRDTGQGMPQEDLPNIFNRFYQSSKNKKGAGGLGIGLALSMELVKLMDGSMWVESKLGEGSTFYLEIPKKEIIGILSTQDKLSLSDSYLEASFDSKKQKSLEQENLDGSGNNFEHTILLVEDNPDLRAYVKLLLEAYYNVITAEHGKDAIEQLSIKSLEGERANNKGIQKKQPSLIISDIMMPIMDGYELLRQLKSNDNWRSIPVIMLTARAENKDRLKALKIGVDDYMLKPFNEEELLLRISNLLLNYEERKNFMVAENANSSTAKILQKKAPVITIEDSQWLSKTEALIIEHLTSSLFSVDYLAELLIISRRTLFRKTKSLTGLSPNQYIRSIRLGVAKDLLEQEKCKNVKEVAAKVGFTRRDYFSTLYKKEFGKSPVDYFK